MWGYGEQEKGRRKDTFSRVLFSVDRWQMTTQCWLANLEQPSRIKVSTTKVNERSIRWTWKANVTSPEGIDETSARESDLVHTKSITMASMVSAHKLKAKNSPLIPLRDLQTKNACKLDFPDKIFFDSVRGGNQNTAGSHSTFFAFFWSWNILSKLNPLSKNIKKKERWNISSRHNVRTVVGRVDGVHYSLHSTRSTDARLTW